MIIDGFDNGALEHFLSFDSDNTGLVQILEPAGFDASNFVLKQDNKRYGRDVTFAGGEAQFEFLAQAKYRNLSHQFEKLIEYNDTFGFESDVKYILKYNNVDYVLGELDFERAETDELKYFRCIVVQDRLEALVKRNKDVTVNLLSDTDINGNTITPLVPDTILVKATPLEQTSEWSIPSAIPSTDGFTVQGDPTAYLSLTPAIKLSEIEDTLSPEYIFSANQGRVENALFLRSQQGFDNGSIVFKDFSYNFSGRLATNGQSETITTLISYRVSDEFAVGATGTLSIPNSGSNETFTIPNISMERDQQLWIWFTLQSTDNENLIFTIDVNSLEIEMNATSIALDSVTNQVRLIDAMKQVVTSISGATVNAPEFDLGGLLYDQHIILGNYLRDIDVQKFELTFDDIIDGISEFDADYEVQRDGSIYFGTRDTFYRNNLIDSFIGLPSATFSESYNPRFLINELNWKYNTYEQGQNDSIENSKQGTHTEAQFKTPNQRVENKKSIACPWIRDPFKIESIRRQGLTVRDTTAQENDDSIAIVQGITLENSNRGRTERFKANHIINGGSILEIVNDGGFNWSVSGIQINDTVTITGENAGTYVVGSFGQSAIQLIPVSPTPNPTFQGITFTTINYTINSTDLVVATNEEFNTVTNIADPSRFANITFTIKRNILRFFGSYLKTACSYHPTGTITNTSFKFNGEFASQKIGETGEIVENEDISVSTLTNAILTTKLTNTDVPCSFPRFWNILLKIRTDKGYIEVSDNKGNLIKTHPQELEYDWKSEILTIKGENRIS